MDKVARAIDWFRQSCGEGRAIFVAGSGASAAIALHSSNVVRAMESANSIGCRTLALTGRDGGKLVQSPR